MMKFFVPTVAILAAIVVRPAVAESTIAFLNLDGRFKPATFSQIGVTARETTVYISGQIAQGEKSTIVGTGDLKKQTEKVFENLRIAVEAPGGSMADVAKITTYVVDLKLKDRLFIRDMVKRHFRTPPAYTLVGADA